MKSMSRRATIGFASAAVIARFAPTIVFAEDISNATVGSDQVDAIQTVKTFTHLFGKMNSCFGLQALGEKGKKVAIFGAALVAADVIAGLVFGK